MAATDTNGTINGITNGQSNLFERYERWYGIPVAIDIPTGYEGEEVEINLQDLDDPTELCQLLENEKAEKKYWVTIALAYAKQGQIDYAIDVLNSALQSLVRSSPKDRQSILGCISWLYLLKSRHAPRVVGEGQAGLDVKIKDHYLREATAVTNEATRINPSYAPLFLTRGVLNLLRAALSSSTKTGPGAEKERTESLNQALKFFDEAVKSSDGRNLVALMGRARALYLLRRYAPALATYQQILTRMPNLIDPDPRIGIGCCMWQLGYHDNARAAWERSLSLSPNSKTAHALLGVYYLRESGKYSSDDDNFKALYKKGMAEHINKSYTLDKQFPLSCATFSTYFLHTKRFEIMEGLARKAIEQTDVNAVASDGWFVLARRDHMNKEIQKATESYSRADQARGGQDAGYFPAKFGMIQTMIETGDIQGAKFRLEKILERNKSPEIMTLLGSIYAEDIFAAQKANPKEDKSGDIRKAIRLLEVVRRNWSDDKAKIKTKPDPSVLLYLARLYEAESPLESLKCLQQVEKMQQDAVIAENKVDPNSEFFNELLAENLPPQLHNNIGCFFYGQELYELARDRFETALSATLKLHEKQTEERRLAEEGEGNVDDLDMTDTDALVTSISYNLARAEEALGQREEASKTYEGLLTKRHPDYTEATARLAYISLQNSPQGEGPKKIQAMYQTDYGNTEIRALMGWYYHSSKKKTSNLAEDQENRHYKHTLQGYDKHDLYSLVGMGNIHMTIARDMPKNNDSEKEKRSKMYQKAYEFFDKALQLDPRNAYAAQGVAIALCDDKRNYSDALQILVKVKDTIRDASVYVNLGHVYAELRQYQRSIDNYEIALKKQVDARTKPISDTEDDKKADEAQEQVNGDGKHKSGDAREDAQLLACLSRVWLLKGKSDKSVLSHNTSLEYMKRALSTQPDSPHLQFNVAFIQFQIVQLVNALSETDRTLEDVNAAKDGLEEAIITFEEVANVKNPPYPKAMLEQRAAMSKGTMMRQLERSHQQQSDYERANAEKLKEARERREEEMRKRDEAIQRRQAEEEAREKKIAEVRAELIKETEKESEQLRAAALAREAAEYTTDEETGDRVKRQKPKRGGGGGGGGARGGKRKDRDDDGFIEDDEGEGQSERSVSRTPLSGSDDERTGSAAPKEKGPKKKKRRLERKAPSKPAPRKEREGKYKSAAVIVDSDESDEEPEAVATPKGGSEDEEPEAVATPNAGGGSDNSENGDDDVNMGGTRADEDDEDAPRAARPAPRQRKQLRTIADDDEDDDE